MKINDFKNYFTKYTSAYFFRLAFLLIVYVGLGAITALLQNTAGIKSQIWLAGGAALACIFIWGYSMWPAIFFATIVVKLFGNNEVIPLSSQLIANIAEPVFFVYYCLRKPGFDSSLSRLEDIFRSFSAAVYSGLGGALIGAAGLLLSGNKNIELLYFVQYWAGHSLGLIIITPLILVFSSESLIGLSQLNKIKKNEIIVFSTIIAATILMFIGSGKTVWLYLFFPLVPWTALRLGQQGVQLLVFALSAILIFNLVLQSADTSILAGFDELQFFILIATLQLTGLIMGAGTLEIETGRVNTEKRLTFLNAELEKKMIILKDEKEMAEKSDKAKTEFLANVSHEIRTPLSTVLGFSELLASNNMSAEDRKNSSDIIRRNGLQLTNVINDVLDLSKIQAGKFEMQKLAVSLEEIIEDIKSTLNADAAGKNLAFTVSLESNVPKKIFTDPLRLRQVLINIVGNAIKFTDRGSIEVRIKTAVDHNGNNKIAFVIKDTGVGIPADKIKELFLPFSQINTSPTRRFGGTGLGLALSQKLANALGGEIVLNKSILGQGSEFTLTTDPGDADQIVASEKIMQEQADLQIKKLANKNSLTNKKILIVDDNLDNQSLLSYYLRPAGAIVDLAGDGQSAIQKIHSNQYDLILMDIQMPIMDGYAATEILRKEGYKKPIIALTAHAIKDVRERCMANGFDAYISKPIEKKKFIETLMEI